MNPILRYQWPCEHILQVFQILFKIYNTTYLWSGGSINKAYEIYLKIFRISIMRTYFKCWWSRKEVSVEYCILYVYFTNFWKRPKNISSTNAHFFTTLVCCLYGAFAFNAQLVVPVFMYIKWKTIVINFEHIKAKGYIYIYISWIMREKQDLRNNINSFYMNEAILKS